MDASEWDARYAAAQQWSDEPNALAASLLADVAPGKALDVAAGEGRMALWLAQRGWKVRALDFSAVGLERGRGRAAELAVDVDWQVADATAADLGELTYDLVLVLYLHLPHDQLADVLMAAAGAVGPGGRLVVLGHDRDNVERGVGGPPDPKILYDVQLLRAAAAGLAVDRLEQVERPVGEQTAIDTLLVARRI
ncbi:MAG: class I SAM-dependent methyltransferase [Mycobacteriales bacterium]